MPVYKIAHLADIQINCDSKHAERTFEYRSVLFATAKQIIEQKVDFVVIAGDVFERYATTDNERELYSWFVHELLNGLPNMHMIVIDGNHDIRKRNMQYYDGNDTAWHTNVLQELDTAICSNRYHYNQEAKVYGFGDIEFAVYSELAKYNKDLRALPPMRTDRYRVDVYHGVIGHPTNMGTDFEFEPDKVELQGNCAMLGHIHKMQEVAPGKAYCSSLVQRTFNEGLRYDRGGFAYNYCEEHGYLLWTIDTNANKASHRFVRMHQPIIYLTFVIDGSVSKEHVEQAIVRPYNGQTKYIKLVLDNAKPDALAYVYALCKHEPALQIKKVVSVGKDIRLSDDIQVNAEQIQCTYDEFGGIASNLLQPKLTTKYDKAYADEVFAKTMQLFEQECNYHLHAEQQQYMCLNSAIIDNFKGIGHAELDFNPTGLVALRGQNGQGKTSCFEAIAFALTGQHNRSFKRNAKNKQFIRLFNDKQPEVDIVRIQLYLTIDSKDYFVVTALEKTMNDGWTANNWQSFVKKIVKKVQILDADKNIICEDQDAENWLMTKFGSYDDFAVLHMLDQATLDSIKYMNNDDLANFILQRLGYSVMQKFQYYYQGCKNNALAETPKPTELSDVQLVEQIDMNKRQIEQAQAEIGKLTEDSATAYNDIEKLQRTITFELNRKRQLPEDLIDKLTSNTVGWTVVLAEQVIKDTKDQLSQIAAKQQAQQKANDERNAVIAEASQMMQSLVNAASKYIKEQIDYLQAKRTEQTEEVQRAYEVQQKLTGHEAYTKSLLNDIQNKLKMAEMAIESLQGSIQGAQDAVNKQKTCIANLKTDVCPLCGGPINTEQFEAYRHEQELKLQSLEAEVDRLLNKLHGIEVNQATLQQQLADATVKHDEALDACKALPDITSLQTKLSSTTEALNQHVQKSMELSSPDYQLKLLAANNAELAKQYKQAMLIQVDDTDYATKTAELQSAISHAETIRHDLQMLQGYQETLRINAEIDAIVAKHQVNITSLQQSYARIQTAIATAKASIDKYNEAIANAELLRTKLHAYLVTVDACEAYKWLVFDAMPKYLYQSVCQIVNAFIDAQNLPDSIRPHLSESTYGQLVLLDRSNIGETIERPIIEASGMETTFAGLVISLALHNAKLSFNFPLLLLDELSGKLNTGNANDDTDYLQLMQQVLQNAAKTCSICMIDHRLPDEAFDKVISIARDKTSNVSYTD